MLKDNRTPGTAGATCTASGGAEAQCKEAAWRARIDESASLAKQRADALAKRITERETALLHLEQEKERLRRQARRISAQGEQRPTRTCAEFASRHEEHTSVQSRAFGCSVEASLKRSSSAPTLTPRTQPQASQSTSIMQWIDGMYTGIVDYFLRDPQNVCQDDAVDSYLMAKEDSEDHWHTYAATLHHLGERREAAGDEKTAQVIFRHEQDVRALLPDNGH